MARPTRLVYGFHALSARLRQRPDSIHELYVVTSRDDPRMRALLDLAGEKGVRILEMSTERLERLVPGVRHQGVAAQVDAQDRALDIEDVLDAVEGDPLVLLLDGVTDPHNLGACLRSADAMGVHAVVAPKDRAVGMTPVVEKVASGAAETVPYIMVTNLARTIDTLKDRGLFLAGLAGEAEKRIQDAALGGPLGLVLGAEGAGLRRLTRERCDVLVKVPMTGSVESLNVSVTAGICLYEAMRQRTLPAKKKT
jgi:23S rRNA (guanosine2251-2'-O)-methyltransferase